MCENVNINVQETNETINIVSSEIQEVIDINVFETAEDVTLNITEQLIQVNINKVTGGGGNQTLAQTLVFGNNTGGTDILLNNDDKIQLENNSSIRKGTYDFGQNGGVSRICGVDYEDMWQGGIRHVFDTNGLIRNSTNCFNIVPDSSFDVTLRFKVGSIWTLDDGTNYICTDATEGAAVWELYNVIPDVTGYVPYTGATQNVDLGEYELKAGQVTLDVSPTGTASVGTTRWNNTIGSSETTLKGGSVILKNGVDLVARVVNKVTPNATLTRATYHAVRVSGAQGQRLAVAYAQANSDNNSADTIGLVCEDIATNQEGFIITVGQLEEINTTGSLQGETWADGDVLYLSPTTAGHITNIKPNGATGHIVVMGYVEYAHAIHGKIYVKIMNGWELDELHNVYITSPANNQGLFYDSSDSLWKNETIASALGYTPFELPSLTSGSVLFSNGTTIEQDNAQLFWDDTNNRLGIGTNAPAYNLDILSGATPIFRIKRGTTTELRFSCFSGGGYIGTYNNSPLIFTTNSTDRATIFANGNFAIGTTTDAGYKLDVNGTARVSGTTTITPAALTGTAATSALDIAQTWNTTGAPTALKLNITDTASAINTSLLMDLQVGGVSRLQLNKTGALVFRLGSTIRPSNGTNAIATSNLNGLNFISNLDISTTNVSDFIFINNQGNPTNTTGTRVLFDITRGFAPTSGTGQYIDLRITPTINQTGGANGITRALYINPTLTAAADFRAIEVSSGITILGASTTAKASLRIPSGTAPTTPTNGDIWFDGTDLKIRVAGVTKTFTLL